MKDKVAPEIVNRARTEAALKLGLDQYVNHWGKTFDELEADAINRLLDERQLSDRCFDEAADEVQKSLKGPR